MNRTLKPKPSDPLVGAAFDSGGTLLQYKMSLGLGENGGCGALTYVEGTNGGRMPCGSMLTRFGQTSPYYCGACYASMRPEEGEYK